MNKKILIGGLLTLTVAGLITKNSLAYQDDPNKVGPNYNPQRHEAMLKAFEKKDYNAWKNLMGDRPITKKINASNFSKFIEMRNLMQQGKKTEADKIRAELGLGQGLKKGLKNGQNHRYNINK